jgi:hypothetical protein
MWSNLTVAPAKARESGGPGATARQLGSRFRGNDGQLFESLHFFWIELR